AEADRNADSLLHLLLDALGGSGHELVALLVEQQDRARIRFESVTDAVEDLVEQLLERERAESHVGHALQPAQTLGSQHDLAHTPTLARHADVISLAQGGSCPM